MYKARDISQNLVGRSEKWYQTQSWPWYVWMNNNRVYCCWHLKGNYEVCIHLIISVVERVCQYYSTSTYSHSDKPENTHNQMV